ncbi:hypothetical protein NL676_009034 [Syzygium grande]|nr:hypothetical protein NL676_009034 [Syzygium grande]
MVALCCGGPLRLPGNEILEDRLEGGCTEAMTRATNIVDSLYEYEHREIERILPMTLRMAEPSTLEVFKP